MHDIDWVKEFAKIWALSTKSIKEWEDTKLLITTLSKHKSFQTPAKTSQVGDFVSNVQDMQDVVKLIEHLVDLDLNEDGTRNAPDLSFEWESYENLMKVMLEQVDALAEFAIMSQKLLAGQPDLI